MPLDRQSIASSDMDISQGSSDGGKLPSQDQRSFRSRIPLNHPTSQASLTDMDMEDRISVRSWDQSVHSYNDSRDSNTFLRELQGRVFNRQNSLYFLPADETEWNRLDKQHLMLLLMVGDLVVIPDKVKERLNTNPDVKKSILDLGTGGGNWAISMAQEFPHVDVVGVDLAPSTTRPPPDNCRFEFDDVNLGLPHYYGKFDVVHARSAANGLPKYEGFIAESARCLKPGGILLLTEGEFQLYDPQKQKVPVPIEGHTDSDHACWYQRIMFEGYHIMKARGSSMDAGYMMPVYLGRNDWFSQTGYQNFYAPCGPWQQGIGHDQNQRLKAIGLLMRQNSMEFFRSLKPLFISAGYPEPIVSKWIERADEELAQLTRFLYTRWHFGWAIVKEDHSLDSVEELPRPPPPFDAPWPLPDVQIDMSKLFES